VTGDFAQGASGKLKIDLAGTTPGTLYDQLLVSGALALAGTLEVSLTVGFQPTSGMAFDILDWSTLSGTFNTITLPVLGAGLAWNTSQLFVSGVLSVGVAGDFNGNGVVEAADYVVWRKKLGTIYMPSDYDVWRSHFGQSAGSGSGASANAAVPEPAMLMLLMLAAAGWCLLRRRAA
jgi:hypothetical protein